MQQPKLSGSEDAEASHLREHGDVPEVHDRGVDLAQVAVTSPRCIGQLRTEARAQT